MVYGWNIFGSLDLHQQSLFIRGYLKKSSENVLKHSSDLWTNLGESSEIFRKWLEICRKWPKMLLICIVKIYVNTKRIFISLCCHVLSSYHTSFPLFNTFSFSFQIHWKPLKECCLSKYSVCLIKWWQCTRMQNSVLKGEKLFIKLRYF